MDNKTVMSLFMLACGVLISLYLALRASIPRE